MEFFVIQPGSAGESGVVEYMSQADGVNLSDEEPLNHVCKLDPLSIGALHDAVEGAVPGRLASVSGLSHPLRRHLWGV